MLRKILNYLLKVFKSKIKHYVVSYKHKSDIRVNKDEITVDMQTEVVISQKFSTKFVDDLPMLLEIKDNTIYLVGENGFLWLAALKCPCGCGDLIQLNLLKKTTPSWRITQLNENNISISPSVNRKVRCKSHFSLTKGEITWWTTKEPYLFRQSHF